MIAIIALFIAGCSAPNTVISTTTTTTTTTQNTPPKEEKLSLFEKMKTLDHLPVSDRIKEYKRLKKESLNMYRFEDEQELNRYGYHLLSQEKTDEAIEIFKLLVSEFPNSFNPYDSLGEAYLTSGNEELAILNYEKSVALNPKNYGAVDQITRINGLELLVTDWGKEIFHFPISFAPKIPYTGVEEVVFPKNWIKKDSADFWSYVFVWAIENETEVNAMDLNLNLTRYFNGLNDDVPEDQMVQTSVDLKRNSNPNDSAEFIGTVNLFDHFATNAEIQLNARIYSNYCETNGKLILLFRFSPQAFEHPVWDLLRTVKVRSSVCDE
jgi:hypothetical protein